MELNSLTPLKNYWPGAHVLIVGNGPSAEHWYSVFQRVGAEYTICINGAVMRMTPDLWLCLESDVAPSIWYMQACRNPQTIRVVNRQHATRWPRGCIYTRRMVEPDIRESALGLHLPIGRDGVRRVGTSAISALHLAGIMGAARVSLIGVDMQFKGAQQHWVPGDRYGEAKHMPQGEDWWEESAAVLTAYAARCAAVGMPVTDYSKGRLRTLSA